MLKQTLGLYQKYTDWVESLGKKSTPEPIEEPAPLTPLQSALALLDPDLFVDYNNQFNAIKIVKSQVENMGLLEKRLMEINAQLRMAIQVNGTYAQEDIVDHQVASWFLDDKGFYVDNVAALDRIKTLSYEFDEHYTKISTVEMGIIYFNWRHLQRFAIGLEATLTSLVALHDS